MKSQGLVGEQIKIILFELTVWGQALCEEGGWEKRSLPKPICKVHMDGVPIALALHYALIYIWTLPEPMATWSVCKCVHSERRMHTGKNMRPRCMSAREHAHALKCLGACMCFFVPVFLCGELRATRRVRQGRRRGLKTPTFKLQYYK